jgi:beta-glucosidase
MKHLFLTLALFVACGANMQAQRLPYQDPRLSAEQRAEDLCSRLTLEEKSQLMRNGSPAIPRLGIPSFDWWSEALHGTARNGFATVFPITMGMAASWDDGLVRRVFDAVSDESRAKNTLAKQAGEIKRYQGLSIWTPNINIFRDPRWGRGQETYGEDPYLTARMGLAVVAGLQGPSDSRYRKLLACAKHFAVHSGPEWNRHSFNIEELPERDLWETYLPAFKALVQQGGVAEVMCAYQRFDGEPCCGSNRLLQQILRDEWGFKGLVVSDCGAISDFWVEGRHGVATDAAQATAQAVRSGTDVECGGNYAQLPEAVRRGEVSEEQVNTSVKRLLKARIELGDLDPDDMVEWTKIPASTIASASHKQLAYEMAQETMTLLQNDGILPLKHDARIVVMGPNAADTTMLWGNYFGYPTKSVSIWEGIQGKSRQATYVKGCGYTNNEIIDSRYPEITSPDGQPGMQATYWNNTTMAGAPVATAIYREPVHLSNGGATVFAPGVNLEQFSARFEGTLRPTRSERLHLTMESDDMARLIVNGDTVIDNWKARARINFADQEYAVEAGKTYRIQIDYVQNTDVAVMNFDLGPRVIMTDDDLLKQVGDADVVVYVGGISPRLEGEEMKVSDPGFQGGDRTTIELPQSQRSTIARLHAAGKKVVYVNCSGGAVALEPESRNANAILQAWYAGESGGKAVADVLFGDYNPSGKLPVTFYKNDAQLPDFLDYHMAGRTYRYFKGEPLFPFGYGLSYTTFAVTQPKYDAQQGKLKVMVQNTGKRDGSTTLQVYIRRVADKEGPVKTLRAYKKMTLGKGQKTAAVIDLPREQFEGWDATTNTMRVVPGRYEVMVGQSSADKAMKTLLVDIN